MTTKNAGRTSYKLFQRPVIEVDWRVFLTQTHSKQLQLFFTRAIIPLILEMQQILLLSKMKLLLRKSVTLLHLWLSKSGDVTMNNSSFSRMRLEIRPAQKRYKYSITTVIHFQEMIIFTASIYCCYNISTPRTIGMALNNKH